MSKSPREVVCEWSEKFNCQDADGIAALYAPAAVNWQVNDAPVEGREAIHESFRVLFRAFPDIGHERVQVVQEGEWAVLEWDGWGTHKGEFAGHPPSGRAFRLRGCGFFQVRDGHIVLQRGYWDRNTWFRQIGIPCD